MLNMVDEIKRDRSLARLLADPYALYPADEPPGPDGRDALGVGRETAVGMWTAPFVMAAINGKIVRRTNALLDFAYGREFHYVERMTTGTGLRGLGFALGISVAMAAMLPAMAFGPIRTLAQRRLPAPGEGPSRELREAGYFVTRLIGEGVDERGDAMQLRGRVEGVKDPGYGETAKMLGESALTLALEPLDAPGGVRTPASTMAEALLGRLRAAGMTFRVELA